MREGEREGDSNSSGRHHHRFRSMRRSTSAEGAFSSFRFSRLALPDATRRVRMSKRGLDADGVFWVVWYTGRASWEGEKCRRIGGNGTSFFLFLSRFLLLLRVDGRSSRVSAAPDPAAGVGSDCGRRSTSCGRKRTAKEQSKQLTFFSARISSFCLFCSPLRHSQHHPHDSLRSHRLWHHRHHRRRLQRPPLITLLPQARPPFDSPPSPRTRHSFYHHRHSPSHL